MCCPNVGGRFRSQYLSHMMPNLGGVFFSFLGQGDVCAQLDWMDLEEKACVHMLLAPWKSGKSPKMTSCGPSNFEGDGLHLNLLQKPKFLGVAHLSFTYCYPPFNMTCLVVH